MAILPYMNILTPTPSTTPGPEWSYELNTALSVIDSHNHTTGQGVQIPSAGLNINQNLSFQGNYLTVLGAARLVNQGSPLGTGSDINTIYASGGNFWFNSGSGAQVQITSGAGLNASSLGAIGGDYGSSTALLAYYNSNQTFVFTQNTNKAAPIDCGQVSIRDEATSANKITLKSPTSLASSYDITLPPALPASSSVLTCSSSGITAFSPTPSVTSLSAQSITLDDGVTDGGAVYFNGGTTSYLKSSNDGLILSLAGFTSLDLPATFALTTVSSLSLPSSLTLTNINTLTLPYNFNILGTISASLNQLNLGTSSDAADNYLNIRCNGTHASTLSLYSGSNVWTLSNTHVTDNLIFGYGSNASIRFIGQSSPNPISLNPKNIAGNATPIADTIYPNTIVKAIGGVHYQFNAANGYSIFNISSVSHPSTGTYVFTLLTSFSSSASSVVTTNRFIFTTNVGHVVWTGTSSNTITIKTYNTSGTLSDNIEFNFVAYGQQ